MLRALLPSLLLAACTAPTTETMSTRWAAEIEIADVPVAAVIEPPPEPVLPQRTPGRLDVTPGTAGDGILPDRPRALIDPELGTMMDTIEMFGWTHDSQRFEHCRPDSGRCGYSCESHGIDGSQALFDDVGESEDVDDAKSAAIRARMKSRVHDAETWAWGGLVEIVWRDIEGDDRRHGSVEVGARLRDDGTKSFPVRLRLDEFSYGHLELVIPSPDGESIALVAHGWAGESTDVFTTRIVAVDELAAEAYQAAGLAALRADDLPRAIDRFAAATSLSKAWKGPYNLACARARAADPNAEAALREAIARGGDTVRSKARTDADLASVRERPWFADLVGG